MFVSGLWIVQGISAGFVELGKLSLTVWPGLNEKYLFIKRRERGEWREEHFTMTNI